MNILLTSAGRRTYLIEYFKDGLRGDGRVYASNSVFTPTLAAADGYVITPQIYNEGYIKFLLNYCADKDITAVISLFDVDLPVLASNRTAFGDRGIKLIVSNAEFIKICNDKFLTYKFFTENNIPTIKTFISLAEVEKALNNEEITYPVVVKPRFGMGSIGVFFADNLQELHCFYSKCREKISSSYLKFESAVHFDDCVIMQEYISGQEYGLDIINDLNGKYINTVCKHKIAMRAGETDIAETVYNPLLKQYGKTIAQCSGHIANLDCDVLVDENGGVHFLELNGRFGGGYPFSHMAGINLPKAIVCWLQGENGNRYVENERIGVRSYKELTIVSVDKGE